MADTAELTWDGFGGGLNTEKPLTKLAPAEYGSLKNLIIQPYGSRMDIRPGEHQVINNLTSSGILGFTRATISGVSHIVYATASGNFISVFDYNESTHVYSGITNYTGPLVNHEFARFNVFGKDKVIWTDGYAYLKEWGGGNSFVQVGLVAEAVPLTIGSPDYSPGAGGLRIGTTLNPISYAYYYTYGTPDGLESNPSPISLYYSAPLSGRSPGDTFALNLTSIQTSADPRVDRRYIYRIGDNITIPTRVGTIANNSSNTFLDTVSDLDAGFITLSFNHDPPPDGMQYLVVNKSRLIGSKNFTVYVSNNGNPEYWPATFTLPGDGQQFAVDPDSSNPITGLGTTGSATIIARRKNIYLLQGTDADQMTLGKIADIGCVSGRTLKMCRDMAVWMAPDGMVWALGAGSPVRLGLPIERTLHAIPSTWLASACAAYFNDRYVICVPGPLTSDVPYVFAFDFRGQSPDGPTSTEPWLDLSASFMSATQMYADTGISDLNELLFATAPGYVPIAGGSYRGIVSTLNPTDAATITVDIKSGKVNQFGGRYRTIIEDVRIRGKHTGSAVLTLTAQTGATIISKSYPLTTPLSAESSILLERKVDAGLVGRDIYWEISGACSDFELEEVTLNLTRTNLVVA